MPDDFPDLTGTDSTLVFQQARRAYTLNVYEDVAYRWLTLGSSFIQSLIRCSEPSRVLLPYTQAMLLALVFRPDPQRLLNLGCGGGTFERFLFNYYPDLAITSVEPNSDIVKASREFFQLPSSHPVLSQSANAFLTENAIKYDLIFCDIHDGKQHPDDLYDAGFYSHIRRCLTDDGVLVMNLVPDSERQLLDILLPVRKVFGRQQLLDFDDYKNVILYVFAQAPRAIPANDSVVMDLKKRAHIDLTGIIDRLRLLPGAVYTG